MYLWTAFIVGLVGSLHCVGMCGPIALALPKGGPSQLRFLSGRVLYNTGRVLTYTLMGFVWGLLGQGISLAGYQQGLSLALGVSLLLALLVSVNLESRFIAIPLIDRLMLRLRKALGKLLGQPRQGAMLAIGVLNGFLPCGFVYIGLAGAISMGNAWGGAAYMALFGLGTYPLMLATSLIGGLVGPAFRQHLRPLMTSVALIFALLFILRGLNLGIPYVSPKIATAQTETPVCH